MSRRTTKGKSPSKSPSISSSLSTREKTPESNAMDTYSDEDNNQAESTQRNRSRHIENTDHADLSEEDTENDEGRKDQNGGRPKRSSLQNPSPNRSSIVLPTTPKYSQNSTLPASTSRSQTSSDSVQPTAIQKQPQSPSSNINKLLALVLGAVVICYAMFSNSNSDSLTNDKEWRSKVDPSHRLSNNQRSMVFASLKPILEKSSTSQDEGVSTLLILSSNEDVAAKLGQCLLRILNQPSNTNQISAEIDLQKHHGGKQTLDSKLRTLFGPTDDKRAVLLRHINGIPTADAFEQLQLLFAYCDGENPVIPHRLIIMTATSHGKTENDLRQQFQNRWPNEHDFIDALMSRISGHTLHLSDDQQSIC